MHGPKTKLRGLPIEQVVSVCIQSLTKSNSLRSPQSNPWCLRYVESGDPIILGTPIVVLSNLADAWLNVYVSEPDVARLRLGQDATVSTDAGQTRSGKVTYISPNAEFTPKNVQTREERTRLVFRIKVALENADGLFKPGMPAEARLTVADRAK